MGEIEIMATGGISVVLVCLWTYKTISAESPSPLGWRIFLVKCFPGLLQRKVLGDSLTGAFLLPGEIDLSDCTSIGPYLSCLGFGSTVTLKPC